MNMPSPPTHPQQIEDRSMEIIAQELGPHGFRADELPVVKRVIHATADFELGRSLVFGREPIAAGVAALRAGRPVVVDVQMIQAGINKERLARWGCEVRCHISDPDVAADARAVGLTRAIVAMRKAARLAEGAIFAIGNAPTALLELVRLVEAGEVRPSLIVGVPVGFVSAAESKDLLISSAAPVPFISNRGRKGGTPVAVAIVNALSLLAAGTTKSYS